MTLSDLFPSRLTIAAVAACAVLIPVSAWLTWSGSAASRDRDRAEVRVTALTAQIENPTTGYIARLAICRGSLAVAEASVQAQNAAVDRLQFEGRSVEARAAEAVRSAQLAAREANGRAAAVLQALPNPNETRCDAAFRLHQENLR